jgi:GTP1/Obg family GTP-binding protein
MPAKSTSQQKLMGIVRGLQKGTVKSSKVSGKANKLANTMDPTSVGHFASTKHKGLPKKVKKEYMNNVGNCYAVVRPKRGIELESMIKEFDPTYGVHHCGLDVDDVHSIYSTIEEAQKCAEQMHKEYSGKLQELENKKGNVTKKINTAIEKLEAKRKEHVKLAKENPANAGKHRDAVAKYADQIEDLMTKLQDVERSKKELDKKEEEK